MLAPTHRFSEAGSLLLLALLSLLLACASLAQIFAVIPYPNLFIRLFELLFAGVFLLGAGRRYEAPGLPRAAGWLLLGWLAVSFLSVAFAPRLGPALTRQAEWLTHLLFAVALWSFLQRHAVALRVILLMVPLGFLLVGLHTLATWMTLDDPRTYNWFVSVPLVGHVRHFGYYALAGLIFCAAPLLGHGGRATWHARAVALVGMALCWGFLCWTGGRAALGAGLVGLGVLVWFTGRGQRMASLVIAAAALALGLWLSTFFAVADPRMGLFASFARTAADASANGLNGLTTGRLNIWAEALHAFAQRPWLGLGPDGYRFLPPQAHAGIQPHSLFVQFLVDWGLLGAVLFVPLLGLAVWHGVARLLKETDPRRRAARVTALALIVGVTIHGLVDGLFYYAQPLLFLFACFAIVLLPVAPAAPAPASPHPVLRALGTRPTLWGAWLLLSLVFLGTSDFVYRLFS